MASELFPIIDEDNVLQSRFLRDFNIFETFGITSSSNAYRHAELSLRNYLNRICGYELNYLFNALMLGNENDLEVISAIERDCYEFLGFETLANYLKEQRISAVEVTNIGNSQRMGRLEHAKALTCKDNINNYFKLNKNFNCKCNCGCNKMNSLDLINIKDLENIIFG